MFTREVFELSRSVYEQVLDKKNEEIERLTITQVELGKTIDGLNAEIERLRHKYANAVGEVASAATEIEQLRVERDEVRKTMREWSENYSAEIQQLRSLLCEVDWQGMSITPNLLLRIREALGEKV